MVSYVRDRFHVVFVVCLFSFLDKFHFSHVVFNPRFEIIKLFMLKSTEHLN